MVKAIDEGLADADGENIHINEWPGGCKNLSVVVVDTREDGVPGSVIVRLPDLVKGCMRLLGISWAELVEEGVED